MIDVLDAMIKAKNNKLWIQEEKRLVLNCINSQDFWFNTPLHYAAMFGH